MGLGYLETCSFKAKRLWGEDDSDMKFENQTISASIQPHKSIPQNCNISDYMLVMEMKIGRYWQVAKKESEMTFRKKGTEKRASTYSGAR